MQILFKPLLVSYLLNLIAKSSHMTDLGVRQGEHHKVIGQIVWFREGLKNCGHFFFKITVFPSVKIIQIFPHAEYTQVYSRTPKSFIQSWKQA